MNALIDALRWPLRMAYRGLAWVANSPRALIGSYFALLVVGGGLYAWFEDKNLGEAVWWAVVTASTVGYGDTYPRTGAGRVVAGTLISVMVLLVIPLITAHFASKLIVDHDAFNHEEQEEIKEHLRRIRVLTEELAARAEVAAADRDGPAAGPAARPPGAPDHPGAG